MSISLTDISVGQLALYCLYFALICVVALTIWIIFLVISNVIEKLILGRFFSPQIGKKIPSRSLTFEEKKLLDKYKKQNKINRYKNIVKAIINWIEKILVISLILFLILVLIKLLITNETFAYTIITLFVFIISSQIASFLRSSWSTDRYIFSPIIKIGEIIEIDNEIGTIENIGKEFFWLDCKTERFGCKKVRFPLSHLNFQKFAKLKDENINGGGIIMMAKKNNEGNNKKNNILTKRKISKPNLYDYNLAKDFQVKII